MTEPRTIPDRLSISQARTWERCRRQWRYRYVDHLADDAGPAAHYGRAVHAALAAGYRVLMLSGEIDAALVRLAAVDALACAWETGDLGWEWDYDGAVAALERTFDDETVAAHLAARDVVAVEHYVTVELEGRTNDGVVRSVAFRGVVDLALAHHGGVEIRDFKTGRVAPARGDRQLHAYADAWTVAFPERPALAHSLAWPVLDRVDRDLEPDPDVTAATRRWLLTVRDEIEDAARLPLAAAYPASPGAVCSWCNFAGVCPDAAAVLDLDQP